MTDRVEEWRPVVGWTGEYEVSNRGSVRSVSRIVYASDGIPRQYHGALRKLMTKEDGHIRITLGSKRRRHRDTCVHTLVAEAFIGPRPLGMHVCHNDGNPANNDISNLRYDTPKGNGADSARHGVMPRGVKQHRAKLTDEIVREIRNSPLSFVVLGKKFGVSSHAIYCVKHKKTWRHV